MERLGFYLFLILVVATVGLLVKVTVVACWNAGKLDATTDASSEEIYKAFLSDSNAIVMHLFQNRLASISSLIVFVAVNLLTPVSVFSAAGYSAATYVVLGFVLPRAKQALSFSRSKSRQET